MPRLLLSDKHWTKLQPISRENSIYRREDLPIPVEGMLYRMRISCPWRNLPDAFGPRRQVYKRFNAWCSNGRWLKIFQVLVMESDLEGVFMDASYTKAHQHSAGAADGQDQAVDVFGLLAAFEITGGQVDDCTQSHVLIAKLPIGPIFIGDKGYGSEPSAN